MAVARPESAVCVVVHWNPVTRLDPEGVEDAEDVSGVACVDMGGISPTNSITARVQ
jgi:hypothetical protein